jgi:hypothetical protein
LLQALTLNLFAFIFAPSKNFYNLINMNCISFFSTCVFIVVAAAAVVVVVVVSVFFPLN